MARKKYPSTLDLLAKLPQQIVELVKIEYDNGKREVLRRLKSAGVGLAAIVIALFFLPFILHGLFFAAIAALALVWPWWLAALSMSLLMLLLAAIAVFLGVKKLSGGNPIPEETLGRAAGDARALAEVSQAVRGEEPSRSVFEAEGDRDVRQEREGL